MLQKVFDVPDAVEPQRVLGTIQVRTAALVPNGEVASVRRKQYFGRCATWIVKKRQTNLVSNRETGGLLCLGYCGMYPAHEHQHTDKKPSDSYFPRAAQSHLFLILRISNKLAIRVAYDTVRSSCPQPLR